MRRAVIGRGTWLDKVAHEVVERERLLGRSLSLIRVESGLGASGVPHIGSLSDAVRAYGVKLAIEDAGYKSELIAFSDDMDGLRRVPSGLPRSLEAHLGEPVSRVPDPFSCHSSYASHMSGMLLDALDELGVEYKHYTGEAAYKSGLLSREVDAILGNWRLVGEEIREMTGQDKFLRQLPYFPVCRNCGRIYTTVATSYDRRTGSVHYSCEGSEVGGRFIEGCGFEGDVKIGEGEGKLSWKVEFAARWSALDVRFEAYGKDIEDSVRVNDWVSDNVLGHPHPYHVRYELFLDKSGRKISKSAGNVLTPQTWLRYGTKQSLVLLMFKRIAGARSVSVEEIPRYVDEYDWLEDVYFGRARVEPEEKLVALRGLYEYVNFLRPPGRPEQHVPFRLLAELAYAAPPDDVVGFVFERLRRYGMVGELTDGLRERIMKARNWAVDVMGEGSDYVPSRVEAEALMELAGVIRSTSDARAIQNAAFEVARRRGVDPPEFFKTLYRVLIGSDRGPRFSSYVLDIGRGRAASILEDAARRALGS